MSTTRTPSHDVLVRASTALIRERIMSANVGNGQAAATPDFSTTTPSQDELLRASVAFMKEKITSANAGNGQAAAPPEPEESSDEEDDEDFDDDDSLNDFDPPFEELDDVELIGGPDSCSMEEAQQYRNLLRDIGPVAFCRKTVESGHITAKKLVTAFGMKLPDGLEGEPDTSYYRFLSLAISRELSKRVKLPQYNTIDDAITLIKTARNIIVLTGAGISTSLGIPDFRSAGGLYSRLRHLDISDPQEVFDISLFKRDPTIFYSVAKDILPDGDRYSPTHKFIFMLQQMGKLLTNYSQNIDNIEAAAGILPEKLIQCHGSFATASCVLCKYQIPMEPTTQIYKDIKSGVIPKCEKCIANLRSLKVAPMKRKRSQNGQDKKRKKKSNRDDDTSEDDDDDDNPSIGVMKPDITFFGEPLPDRFSERLTNHDKRKVDLVIVIGTSLKVAPVSEVVPYLPREVPQMYISREPVQHVNFDIDMLGDCDVVVAELCRRMGWDLDHEMVPPGQVVDVQLAEGSTSRHIFKARTPQQPNGDKIAAQDLVD